MLSSKSPVRVGDEAPDFETVSHTGKPIHLASYRGKQAVVLFFYPKSDTPVCSREACGFRDEHAAFAEAGAEVIGVSSDSVKEHQRFAAKYALPYALISDPDSELRKLFGVPKSLGLMPGRVTYVIDREGIVQHVFNAPFMAAQHVREALETVTRLQAVA
ncbi:MAG: peroxiredoxin [Bacteroidota bacterium]